MAISVIPILLDLRHNEEISVFVSGVHEDQQDRSTARVCSFMHGTYANRAASKDGASVANASLE
jgi:hypothetical protein